MSEKDPLPESHVAAVGPLAFGQRWSLARKREVALRLLCGEPIDALSRELGVEVYRLERWKEKAFAGLDAGLKEREGDPLQSQLDAALRRIGELSMENELLHARIERPGPLGGRRSKR
jgi:transposase